VRTKALAITAENQGAGHQHRHANPENPRLEHERLAARRDVVGHQNRNHNQDGHRAHIDQNLGEPDEFRAEAEKIRRQAKKRDGGAKRAMHQVAQGHRGDGAAERQNEKQE